MYFSCVDLGVVSTVNPLDHSESEPGDKDLVWVWLFTKVVVSRMLGFWLVGQGLFCRFKRLVPGWEYAGGFLSICKRTKEYFIEEVYTYSFILY